MICSKIVKSTLLVAAMILVFACVHADTINDYKTYLVAYYPLNGNAKDQSGNHNHGSAFGGVTLTADRSGNAKRVYHFDGRGSGVWVDPGSSLNLSNFSRGYTIAAWIKPEGKSSVYQNIISKQFSRPGYPPNMHTAFFIRLNDNRIETGHANPDGSDIIFKSFELLTNNKWHHVALTWKNTTPNAMAIYLNGEKVLGRGGIPKGLLTSGTDGGVSIGHLRLHEANKWFFKGTIDEARIYKRALTQAQIEQIMVKGDSDSDGDGVLDSLDNCVIDYNQDQLDSDGDGVGNICDPDDDNDGFLDVKEHPDCVDEFNPQITWTDINGTTHPCVKGDEPTCSQPDFDLDKIPDACDPDADDDGEKSFAHGGLDCDDMDPKTPLKIPCIFSPGAGEAKGSSTSAPDFDRDRIIDTEDNCPSTPNRRQKDEDGDGLGDACDFCKTDTNNDPDRDRVCDDGDKSNTIGDNFCTTGIFENCDDNCPDVSNPNQADSDGDGKGDVCDTDSDGDGKISIYHGGNDCNDYDATIHPGNPDKDKDCDPFTSEADHYITFPGASNFNDWLPKPGDVLTFDVVLNSSKPIVPGTWHVDVVPFTGGDRQITQNPGQYFNDPDRDVGEDFIFVVNDTADPKKKAVTITCKDYAGSITIHAQVQVDESASSKPMVASKVTFPKDSDEDGLPDAWEIHFGDLIHDNDDDNDDLTNFEEYWGFKWGPELVKVAPVNSGGRYQTVAYVPQGDALFFRTDPTRPDLFGKVVGYDFNIASFTTWAIDAVHGYDEPKCNECFFAIGEAYNKAGINVHVLSLNNLPQHMDADIAAGVATGIDGWVKYIDAQGIEQHFIKTVQINNRLDSPMSGTDGHNNKRPLFVRDWTWDTKGWSGFGDDQAYGLGTTSYWVTLHYYVHDLTYRDQPPAAGGTINNLLDPIHLCEDENDNGINDQIGHGPNAYWEAGCPPGPNCNLDGDLYIPGSYSQDLSTFDIDKDFRVELPVKTDPTTLDPLSLDSGEYTIPQILKSTITHEWGHAIGTHENGDPFCIMYSISINWKRDDRFSPYAIGEMRFHNH